MLDPSIAGPSAQKNAWRPLVAKYENSDPKRALWQVANSFLPYAVLWYLMYRSLTVSYWLTLGLAIIAAGFLVRIFIIFHDCGHGSFFRSTRANDFVGFVAGVLTLTPYHYWRHTHAIHHATAGNLDRRGVGDIWTMTMAEFREASRWKKLGFRLYRNPLVLFVIGPFFISFIQNRFVRGKEHRRWQPSVQKSNLGLLVLALGLSALMGWKVYCLLQLTVMMLAAIGGVWLFYVQHQFDGVYWERKEKWDYLRTALEGSSFYRLPRLFQWFSGNIGFHHIHHLSPRIPNYFLDHCHKENPLFQSVRAVHFRESWKCLTYRVWDEDSKRLVGLRPAWF